MNLENQESPTTDVIELQVIRTCRICKETASSDVFVKSKAFKCGVDTICLSCSRQKVYKWREEGKRKSAAEARRRYQKYPEKEKAKSAARRKRTKQATPHWLSSDDLWIIEEAYHLSFLREKMTGIKWHVDHIVPLKNKQVCGLHVPWNIQVIPAKENLKKWNKYPL